MKQQVPSVGPSSSQRVRRLSADIGGLHLAVENGEQGQGWLGISGGLTSEEFKTQYAELLGDMYTHTLHAVNEHGSHFVPADLSLETRRLLIQSLERWHFEPHKLRDDEVLSCALLLFEALFRIVGMEEATGVSMKQIAPFVYHLRQIYRLENTYHNFEHAVDVLQAVYMYLRAAQMVPSLSILLEPSRQWNRDAGLDSGHLLTSLDLLALFVMYTAAIGHDVGHPGFTNLFMKNAETPLSIVFDGKSALEQMHCQLLLRVMRYHGMGVLLDRPRFRRVLCDTVLATDMSVHDKFMNDFQALVNGENGPICHRQILICQAIMKCADISNPSRPYSVSEHWAGALMGEWSSQALFEKHLHLPTTVQSSDTPLNVAKSQVFFVTTFAKPLLDLTIQAVPEMKPFADQCVSNLRIWTKRLKQLESTKQESAHPCTTTPRHPDDFITAFPLTLPPSHRMAQTEEPRLIWPMASYSQSGDSSSGSSDSYPCSPSPSDSSFVFSPTSESSSFRPPSSAGSCTSCSTHHPQPNPVPDGQAAIRAAGKLGIRKQKSMNRNSWSPCAFSTTPKSAVTWVASTNAPSQGVTDTVVVNQNNHGRSKSKLSR